MIRRALARYLQGLDYQVSTAPDGPTALRVLAEAPDIAVMLTDVRMPGMSGVQLVAQALAQRPDLAILMLTAVDDPKTAAACLELGAYAYLTKPTDLEQLHQHIEDALRRRELRSAQRGADAGA